MKRYQLQEAKAKLSQLVRDAAEEPQEITVHGKPAVILVSRERYRDLAGEKPTFVDFVRGSPLVGADLSLERNRSKTRRPPL